MSDPLAPLNTLREIALNFWGSALSPAEERVAADLLATGKFVGDEGAPARIRCQLLPGLFQVAEGQLQFSMLLLQQVVFTRPAKDERAYALDLNNRNFNGRFIFVHCQFEGGVNMRAAQFNELEFRHCQLEGTQEGQNWYSLRARDLVLAGSLKLDYCTFTHLLNLKGAQVGRHVHLNGTQQQALPEGHENGMSLELTRARVQGNLMLTNKVRLQQRLQLDEALLDTVLLDKKVYLGASVVPYDATLKTVAKSIYAPFMKVHNAFKCHEVECQGLVVLAQAKVAEGVELHRISIKGQLAQSPELMAQGRQLAPVALWATGLDAGRLHIYGGTQLEGLVNFAGASIATDVELHNLTLKPGPGHQPHQPLLNMLEATVGGYLSLSRAFYAFGFVQLSNVHCGRGLKLYGARIVNPGGYSLQMENAQLQGPVECYKTYSLEHGQGGHALAHAITQDMEAVQAFVAQQAPDGHAAAIVTHVLELLMQRPHRSFFMGTFSLVNTSSSSVLDLSGGIFWGNAAVAPGEDFTVALQHSGKTQETRTRVGNAISCNAASFEALYFNLGQEAQWGLSVHGMVDFRNLTCQKFFINPSIGIQPHTFVRITGMVYHQILSDVNMQQGQGGRVAAEQCQWFSLMPEEQGSVRHQPYEQLAKVYDEMGLVDYARRVRLNTARYSQWWDKGVWRIFSVLYRLTTPMHRAVYLLLIFLGLGLGLFQMAYHHSAFQRRAVGTVPEQYLDATVEGTGHNTVKPGAASVYQLPQLNLLAYTFDVALPFLDLKQESAFTVGGSGFWARLARSYGIFLKVAAPLLLSIILIGLSRINEGKG